MLRRPRMRSPDCGLLEHRILSVNLVLRLEVVRVGSGPVAIQGRSDVVVFHLDLPLPSHLRRIYARMALSPVRWSKARPDHKPGENVRIGAGAGWGLHPLEKRRLVTAHVESRRSPWWRE